MGVPEGNSVSILWRFPLIDVSVTDTSSPSTVILCLIRRSWPSATTATTQRIVPQKQDSVDIHCSFCTSRCSPTDAPNQIRKPGMQTLPQILEANPLHERRKRRREMDHLNALCR